MTRSMPLSGTLDRLTLTLLVPGVISAVCKVTDMPSSAKALAGTVQTERIIRMDSRTLSIFFRFVYCNNSLPFSLPLFAVGS